MILADSVNKSIVYNISRLWCRIWRMVLQFLPAGMLWWDGWDASRGDEWSRCGWLSKRATVVFGEPGIRERLMPQVAEETRLVEFSCEFTACVYAGGECFREDIESTSPFES